MRRLQDIKQDIDQEQASVNSGTENRVPPERHSAEVSQSPSAAVRLMNSTVQMEQPARTRARLSAAVLDLLQNTLNIMYNIMSSD